MSDFSPTKNSFYRGRSNRSTRRNFKSGSGSSNGFDLEGGSHGSERKFRSSSGIPDMSPTNKNNLESRNPSYGQRTPFQNKSNKTGYEDLKRNGSGSHTISVIKSSQRNRVKKVVPGQKNGDINHTDTEDNLTIKSTPNKFSKQRKIPRRSIRKLDDKSVPRPPDFSRRETTDNTMISEEKSIFSKLNDADSKVSSKAAEHLLNNFSEYEKEIPNNIQTIISTQSNLF